MRLPYLNEKGLAQASAERVARERATRITEAGEGRRVHDATCGIGADASALAQAGAHVSCGDLDPECALFTRANLEAAGYAPRVVRADARAGAVRAELVTIDPDRRAGGKRSLDPRTWSPSLAAALATAARHEGACLKLAPSLDAALLLEAERAALPREQPRNREWWSHAGELAEVCLWTGVLAEEGAPPRRAVLLPRGGGRAVFEGAPETAPPLSAQEAREVAWIADPDPALLRSGLLGRLAREEGMAPLAARIAFLGGPGRPSSPFLRPWRVLATCALDPRRVRAMLASFDVGPLDVSRRGHPDSAEALARRLRGRGSRRGRLVVARLDPGHRAYLVEDPRGQEAAAGGAEAELVGDEGLEPPTPSL